VAKKPPVLYPLSVLNSGLISRNPSCTGCDLHESALHVCLSMEAYAVSDSPKTHAILVVGEAPGANEDVHGRPFIGKSGAILREVYLEAPKLSEHADIYLTNSVRCRPPSNATPNKGYLRACRPYLEGDVRRLAAAYNTVTLLCAGSVASQAVAGCKQREGLSRQGEQLEFGGCNIRVWHTYHPAFLLRRREPAKINAVSEHISHLRRYLRGEEDFAIPEIPDPPQAPPLPPSFPTPVSNYPIAFDIETYGNIEGYPSQKHFHPRKSHRLDGVPRNLLIQSVCFAWRDETGSMQTAAFLPTIPAHRKALSSWFRKIHELQIPLMGWNTKFDLMYLRYAFPHLAEFYLNESQPVVDVAVYNFLHSDVRDEKSLKNVAPLLNISRYGRTAKNYRWKSPDDPEHLRYNVQDCIVTYRLWEYFRYHIAEDYGSDSPKLSPEVQAAWSNDIWTSIFMEEHGVPMDEDYLENLLSERQNILDRVCSYAEAIDFPLHGKGSQKASRDLLLNGALEYDLMDHPDLEKTEKTGAISTKDTNIDLLLKHTPGSCDTRTKLKLLRGYRKHLKIVSTYLLPLLRGRGKDHKDKSSALIDSISYSSIYIIPSTDKDDKSSMEAGTVQCRWIHKKPAHQTNPSLIKRAFTTRFHPGFFFMRDLSQIELRVPGILSGDPVIIEQYSNPDMDRHTETTKLIFGNDIVKHPHFKMYRHAGKTVNFLTLFGGGATKLHMTLLTEMGFDLPLPECERVIETFWEHHHVMWEWQQSLIKKALSEGYVEVPLIGVSRTFAGSERVLLDTYKSVICNIQVQAVAARILQSALGSAWRELRNAGLQTGIGLQVYDSMAGDGPLHELDMVRDILDRNLLNPPYYQDLCKLTGHVVPLKADEKIQIFGHKGQHKQTING
jgi:uracil-DNA glycosylase family 4